MTAPPSATALPSTERNSAWWVVGWISAHLRRYRGTTILLCLGLVLNKAFESYVPFSLKYIIDEAVATRNYPHLVSMLVGLALGALFFAAISLGVDYLYARLGNALLTDLRLAIFEKLQRLGMQYFVTTPKGEILTRFSTDLEAIEYLVINYLPQGMVAVFGLIFSCIMLFTLEWRLATVAMVGMAANILSVRILERRAAQANHAMKAEVGRVTSALEETISAQNVIRGFNLRGVLTDDFRAHLSRLFKLSMRANVISYVMERLPNVGMVLVSLTIVGLGAVMATRGSITVGTFVSFYALLGGASAAVNSLAWVFPFIIGSATSAERLDELLLAPDQTQDRPDALDLPAFSEALTFDSVGFSYTATHPKLRDFTVRIPKGSRVAFVGASGAGKSTVLSLLLRFYDPDSGAVRFDGVDLREVRQDSLRAQLGVVFQETFLFNTSLRENIRMGAPGAADGEVISAAKRAGIHDFILSLPGGYDELAGERGSRLSGGQRQRIAIARAILRDPPILLLDEATSALDAANEAAIAATLDGIRGEKTLLSVTHRLASIQHFDCIVVLDNGRIVESGTHETLLRAEGFYHSLWEKQSGFSISDNGVATVSLERLRRTPILSRLEPRTLQKVAAFFVTEHHPEGRRLVQQGEPGDRFYFIVRGKVAVLRENASGEDVRISQLTDGDHFGEIALLRDVARTASVVTLVPTAVLSLQREHFHTLVSDSPLFKDFLETELQRRLAEFPLS